MATILNINVSTPNSGNGDTLRDSQVKANSNFSELNAKKVEVVAGKGLSTNDYSDVEKTKLAGIETGAEKNVQANWNQNDNTQDDYIIGKPTSGGITSYGTYSLVGQTLTINAGWVWQINNVFYTNGSPIVIVFPYASAGNQRLDLVVFNTLNSAERVEGIESVSNPFTPPLIENTILFGILLITSSTVGNPALPAFQNLSEGLEFISDGVDNLLDIGTGLKVKAIFLDSVLLRKGDWSQSSSTIIFTFTPALNAVIQII